MSDATDRVRELLRSTDEVTAVLEAIFIPSSDSPNPQEPTHDPRQDTQNRRVLAVISHRDDWDLTEEGCIFVCKSKSPDSELAIQRVLPIYGHFAIVMSQMRRNTLDLRDSAPPKAASERPRSGFSLSITPAEGLQDDAGPALFFTREVSDLRNLVAECRRLKEAVDVDSSSIVNLAQSTTHFSWLRPYILKEFSPNVSPPDLRTVNQPLISRLTPASAGQSGDDHADVQLLREEWVRTQARTACRTGTQTLKLRVGTFNVNGKMPSQDLSSWIQGKLVTRKEVPEVVEEDGQAALPPIESVSPLSLGMKNPFDWVLKKQKAERPSASVKPPEGTAAFIDPGDPDPDVFVLGFQELDLSTEALIYSLGTAREDAWCLAVFAALGEKASKYEKLASTQLVGMLIVVIVKKHLKDCFTDVKTTSAGAGILGVMGNKGGTAVRMTLAPPNTTGSTVLTFVNAHLAAFDEMVDRRNLDFQDLSKRLNFVAFPPPESEGGEGLGDPVPPSSVYESDALFWMGDLNYRVDVPDLDLRRILCEEDWDSTEKVASLLRYDQLTKAMKSKKAFAEFTESPVTHLPTYRFSPGLGMDPLGYDYKRKPAWTDRILYIPSPTCRVEQLSYTAHPQITMSDHRPVAADFRVNVDVLNQEEYVTALRKLYREVDHLEGGHERKGLTVDDTYVDFGNVQYEIPQVKVVKLTNRSKGPCAFRFVSVQADAPIHPEWLTVQPQAGILLPEETMEITLTAYVDNATAALLNRRPKDLSGTLIIHTILGKDHFISVAGEYQHTCFGNSLSFLTQLPGPIRTLEFPTDLLDDRHRKNAPSEIIRLVNWLMSCTADVDDVFLHPADEEIVLRVRECLDTGADFPYPTEQVTDPQIPLAFGVVLLRLLDSLPEPVIPGILHPRCVDVSNRDEAFELLDAIHPAAVNVWISLTAFLHFICKASSNDDQAERIAAVFAPILLRDDPTSLTLPISPAMKEKFLLYFIT